MITLTNCNKIVYNIIAIYWCISIKNTTQYSSHILLHVKLDFKLGRKTMIMLCSFRQPYQAESVPELLVLEPCYQPLYSNDMGFKQY